MLTNRSKLFAALAFAAAACSSGENNGAPNAAVPDTGVDVSVPDTGGDAAPSDAPDVGGYDVSGPVYPVIAESEPNTETSEATAFTQPAVLTGAVALDSDAVDWWEVHLGGPAIVRLTVESGDVGWVEFQMPLGSKRGLSGGAGTTREFFIPTSNRYQIGIVATEERPTVDYRLVVESYEPTPTPLTSTTATGDLDDGNVDVYAWTSTGEGFTIVEVYGERAPISSGLDSFLFVYDDSLKRFEWNDNATATKDSRLDFERRNGAEYLIAVDMYEPTDDHRYELRVQAN